MLTSEIREHKSSCIFQRKTLFLDQLQRTLKSIGLANGAAELGLVSEHRHCQAVPDQEGLDVVVVVSGHDSIADEVRAGVAVELNVVVRFVVPSK